MTTPSPIRLVAVALGCIFAGLLPLSAAVPAKEPLATGSSSITRDDVNLSLYIPATLSEAHGLSGVLVYFGGMGDNPDAYAKGTAALGDSLDIAIVVPQMPWFTPPGKVQVPGVFKVLDDIVGEIETQYHTDPKLVIVGGASAGGSSAADLAKKWSAKTAFLVLASTGPFQTPSKPTTFHVVTDKEISRIGGRPKMGGGRKDSFAIPGGSHSAQLPYSDVWLATEVSALRLEQAAPTIRLAEDKLAKGDTATAPSTLRTLLEAVTILKTPATGAEEFAAYETKRRQELLTKFASTIQTLEKLSAKISPTQAPQ